MSGEGDYFLGIEIGGTKLQLGVGHRGGGALTAIERLHVDRSRGAAGVLEQIDRAAPSLIGRHAISGIGIGFGGPVDGSTGRVIKSHQVDGWENVDLLSWCRRRFAVPARVGNDCDVAALAESVYGAGRGCQSVFYVTVGTGIGGGFVVDGRVHGEGRPAAAEIGHLRPGLHADRPDATVEAIASGLAIAEEAKAKISGDVALRFSPARRDPAVAAAERLRVAAIEDEDLEEEYKRDLLDRVDGDLERLTATVVVQAARDGNRIAGDVLQHACRALGWAIAQVVTLFAPQVVVIGGGVSLAGDDLFFGPIRSSVRDYVFPPLLETYRIVPAVLGQEVVVYGAIALAALKSGDA